MTFKEIMRQVNQYLIDCDAWMVSTREGLYPTAPKEALKELARAADEGRIVEVPLRGDCETVEVPDLDTAKMPKVT